MSVEISMKLSAKQAGKIYMKSLGQEQRIKELEQELGLLKIVYSDKCNLLKSCEQALLERDGVSNE